MKKFYSILALALMCMVGTASAESLTLNAETNRSNNPSISDGTVTFTLNNAKYERPSIIFHWERVYMIENNVDAYLNWELNDPSKTIKINSVEFLGRCEFNGNYITAETNYMPRPNIIIENRVFDFGAWYNTVVSGEFLFGPSEDLTGGEIHLVDHRANIANGGCQIQHITINYTIVEKAATQTVYATPEGEIVFGGDWNTAEINDQLANGDIPVRGTGEAIDADIAGVVDITGVTGDLNNRQPIITPNPNTMIVANEGQISNPQNVIVNGVCNFLRVVDPLMWTPAQEADNYRESDCGWYCNLTFVAETAVYERPMSYTYGTLALPFSYEMNEINARIFNVEEFDGSNLYITYADPQYGVGAREAVIVGSNRQSVNVVAHNAQVNGRSYFGFLTPEFAKTTIGAGQYCIAKDQFWAGDNNGKGTTVTVYPYRAWFGRPEGTEVNAKALNIVVKEETAINNVEAATTIAPAYNLQGVRVAPNAKGFVIVNGKKYFNK